MKKKMVLSVVCLIALSAFGQSNDQDLLRNINWKEDSTEITTVNDIIKMQQDVTNKNYMETHFRKVWSRKTYWNVSYNTTTLTPNQVIETGVNGGKVPEFKSDWGISVRGARNYALHKTPIANMVQFNLDWTYLDLGVNHFKKEGDGKNLYDSRAENETSNKSKCYYTPWNLEKYEANFGMALGPSISIAPFTTTNLRGLHYMKLNAYYHIGYHCSLLWMQNDEKADVNQKELGADYSKECHEDMAENAKLDLGHGLTQSFGFSLTWKVIGIGWEYRSAAIEYQSLSSSDFGKDKYKFKSGTNRFFIQFRL